MQQYQNSGGVPSTASFKECERGEYVISKGRGCKIICPRDTAVSADLHEREDSLRYERVREISSNVFYIPDGRIDEYPVFGSMLSSVPPLDLYADVTSDESD